MRAAFISATALLVASSPATAQYRGNPDAGSRLFADCLAEAYQRDDYAKAPNSDYDPKIQSIEFTCIAQPAKRLFDTLVARNHKQIESTDSEHRNTIVIVDDKALSIRNTCGRIIYSNGKPAAYTCRLLYKVGMFFGR
jgi:hypothetical protein